MGFMDELRTHNTLSPNANRNMASYFGQPGGLNNQELMNDAMNAHREKQFIDTEDWKQRKMFEDNLLQTRQNRMQGMIPASGPTGNMISQQTGMPEGPMNVVMGQSQDPNKMTPAQMANLQLDRQKLALDTRKADSADQVAQGKLGLAGEAQDLNEQKNKNIYETKMAEAESKAAEADRKYQFELSKFEQSKKTSEDIQRLKQVELDARNAQHDAEMKAKDRDREEAQRLHDTQIEKMKAEIEAGKGSTVKTNVNPDGTEKTVTTVKGAPTTNKAPAAPAGWNYVRNSSNTGWTAVKAGAK